MRAMPKGPKGQKRPADVIGAAVMIAKIATGEDDETEQKKASSAAAILVSLGGKAGGKTMNAERR